MRKNFIYAKLPAVKCTSLFRIGGNGLANCMFVAARAFVYAKKYNLELIEPTWFNFSLGTYLRGQKDKRHYLNIFDRYNSNSGLKKIFLLNVKSKNDISEFDFQIENTIYVTEGLGNYFGDILDSHYDVNEYFTKIINKDISKKINEFDFKKTISVHIRLGDYSEELRTPLKWYVDNIKFINGLTNGSYRFLIFSDGDDVEINDVLELENTKRVFFGSAVGDILAISKTNIMIGSDSTFSGWGSFLGQVPSIFEKKHFGRILKDESKELVFRKLTSSDRLFVATILNY
jgi:hypothetical protein